MWEKKSTTKIGLEASEQTSSSTTTTKKMTHELNPAMKVGGRRVPVRSTRHKTAADAIAEPEISGIQENVTGLGEQNAVVAAQPHVEVVEQRLSYQFKPSPHIEKRALNNNHHRVNHEINQPSGRAY